MARITDTSKLERIKQATISLIVEKGYGGASIAHIAKKADVADGYLYRHYASKDELVKSLFDETVADMLVHIGSAVERYTCFPEFVRDYHLVVVDVFNENPDKAKFFVQLMNDFYFDVGEDNRQLAFQLFSNLLERARHDGEVSAECSLADIYTILLALPLQIYNFYVKGFFRDEMPNGISADIITRMCLKIMQ